MDPVLGIGFWAVAFVGSHFVLSSAQVRPRLVGMVGEQRYRGIYSLVAFVTLVPLIITFGRHKHAGPMLWYLRDFELIRIVAWLLMFFALILFVASFVSPNPGAIGASGRPGRVAGMLKLTRHPSFVAIATFGFAHMLMNGSLGDVVFFATFPALGILGGIHQDRRKIRELGEQYRVLIEQTSFFPGAALWSGRQKWTNIDMPWAAIGIGAALTIVVIMIHPIAFGGSPVG
jgi:uncharacterized membrane protein